MQLDLFAISQDARESIVIPPAPLEAIRAGAVRAVSVSRLERPKRKLATLLAVLSLAAVAAAPAVWNGAHMWLSPSGALDLSTKHLRFSEKVDAAHLREVEAGADFPVTLPSGLPAGTELIALGRAGTSAVLLQYNLPGAWRRSNHLQWILLANPKAFTGVPTADEQKLNLWPSHGNFRITQDGTRILFMQTTGSGGGVRFAAGREEVIVLKSMITEQELAAFKRAMQATAR